MKEKLENHLALIIVFVFLAIFGAIAFIKGPDTVEILENYEDITQPVDETDDSTPIDEEEDTVTVDIDNPKANIIRPTASGDALDIDLKDPILSSNTVSVRSFVYGVVEEGAECSYVLRDSSSNVISTVTNYSIRDAKYTICGTAEFSTKNLNNGTYFISLEYISDKYDSVSSPVEFIYD